MIPWPPFLTGTTFGLVLLLSGGSLLLWFGAEAIVKAAAKLALRAGLGQFLVGATVVAFGTSAPEWVVSFIAHVEGTSAIALGNVVGSNVCNLALVLGITAIVLPIRVRRTVLVRELPLVLAAECAFWFLAKDGELTRLSGLALLAIFVAFYVYLIRATLRLESRPDKERIDGSLAADSALLVASFVLLALGADAFVAGAAESARQLGMSETVVGATVVALGTSLPELATSSVAALRGNVDVSLGNILGSNLFNILFVTGSLGVVAAVPCPEEVVTQHVPWMLATTLLVIPLCVSGKGPPAIGRLGGSLLVAAYATYIVTSL